MNKKKKIQDFLATQELAVVSTSLEGKPQGAVVAYALAGDLSLVFGTSNTSRKYRALQKDPRAAFVIGWSLKDKITVQYEGVAKELTGKEREKLAQALIARNKFFAKFHNLPDQAYFKVVPTWIRYSDGHLGEHFEIESR